MLAARPWLRFYPAEVAGSLAYPELPLHALLQETARKYPDRAAVWYEGAALRYGQLAQWTERCAAALVQLGVQKGSRVALSLPNIPQFMIGFFGALRAGATVVPCNVLYKERELEFQLRDAGADAIIAASDVVRGADLYASLAACRDRLPLRAVVTTSVTDFLPALKRRLAPLAKVKPVRRPGTREFMELLREPGPPAPPIPIAPRDDIAVLQYTGGTTGPPKGAMLTHFNLVSNTVAVAKWHRLREAGEVVLGALPLFHVYGLTTVMNAAIYTAATVVLMPRRFDPKEALGLIARHRVTLFPGVPRMYSALVSHPEARRHDLSSLRACFSGAAPLPVALMQQFKAATGANLVEGYGLSEASPVTHSNPSDALEKVRGGSIGLPLPDTDFKIVDLDMAQRELPPDEVGELAIRGPQVMKGYWQRPEETAQVLRDGWLFTGDVARCDADGYCYIVDRKKDIINVAGLKVWPCEVEEVMFEHPAVKDVGVVGAPDPERGEVVRAFVILKAGQQATAEELIAFCKARLAAYKAPRSIEFRSELPLTLIGKVLRRSLRAGEPADVQAVAKGS
jgi:long-chain acyl-CoA synthetase